MAARTPSRINPSLTAGIASVADKTCQIAKQRLIATRLLRGVADRLSRAHGAPEALQLAQVRVLVSVAQQLPL
jgi:hypothetical protein